MSVREVLRRALGRACGGLVRLECGNDDVRANPSFVHSRSGTISELRPLFRTRRDELTRLLEVLARGSTSHTALRAVSRL